METGAIGGDQASSAWDLFGDALEHFQRHGHCAPYYWMRDDGSRIAESIAFYFAAFESWNAQERAAAAMARGCVLDAGCGAGKHALFLQEHNAQVVGIDGSSGAVRVCRARGVRHVREMSLFDPDFAAASFDCVTLFTNNLSLGGTPDGVAHMLDALGRILKPTGRIVLTNLDVSVAPGTADLAYHEANRRAGRLPGQIRMRPEHNGRAGTWIDWLFLSAAELDEVSALAGWRVAEVVNCAGPYAAMLRR